MKRLACLALLLTMTLTLFGGCGRQTGQQAAVEGWEPVDSMKLDYATEFAVEYYPEGYKLISLSDGSRYLVIPEGKELPDGTAEDVVPLYQPVRNIYLAATAVMCLFDGLDRLDAIALSGTKAEGWYIDRARQAMERGEILFAGKYNEPDYELLLSENCQLAVESMMIGHASEIRDKLEELGIPVLMDQSSKEAHPLGRTEWIKLYAALLNEEERAEALFREQTAYLDQTSEAESTGKTVAFFYVSSSGRVVARKSGDYVCKMIELAGGDYVFEDLGDSGTATSTVTIEMETFFATAKDADIIIYNSTIGGQITTLEELLEKSDLFREFKAVQQGNVWCTEQNMYQQTTQLGQMIQSFRQIFAGEAEDVPFLYKLK